MYLFIKQIYHFIFIYLFLCDVHFMQFYLDGSGGQWPAARDSSCGLVEPFNDIEVWQWSHALFLGYTVSLCSIAVQSGWQTARIAFLQLFQDLAAANPRLETLRA